MGDSTRKPKICLVTTSFPLHPGDAVQANFSLGVIDYLVALGNDVTVFTHDRPDNPRYDWKKFRVHYFKFQSGGKRASELKLGSPVDASRILQLVYGGAMNLARLQRSEKFDAILCLWAIPAGLYAYLARRINPDLAPYATWALGSDVNRFKNFYPTRLLLRAILRGARFRFADGLGLADDVAKISGLTCEFAATSRALDPSPHALPSVPTSARRFLYVGRHDRVKGTDVLIESLILLSKSKSAFVCEIVSEGPLTAKLKARVTECGLGDSIRFVGKITDRELAELYQRTDCVVIPSRSESIPVVLGEAVRFSKPLIVTDVGDMGRLVRDYRLGQVVATEDAAALARGLEEFCLRPTSIDEADGLRLTQFLALDRSAALIAKRLKEMTHHESNSIGRRERDPSLSLHGSPPEAASSGG